MIILFWFVIILQALGQKLTEQKSIAMFERRRACFGSSGRIFGGFGSVLDMLGVVRVF